MKQAQVGKKYNENNDSISVAKDTHNVALYKYFN